MQIQSLQRTSLWEVHNLLHTFPLGRLEFLLQSELPRLQLPCVLLVVNVLQNESPSPLILFICLEKNSQGTLKQ